MGALLLDFYFKLITIIVINLVLSGDNAVVIALAVKTLPRSQRARALTAGAVVAVAVLVTATFFATQLLRVKFLQLSGGIIILWIALKLFRQAAHLQASQDPLTSFLKAIWFIVLADITMSTDNILAVAGVSQGNLVLMTVGLAVSVPFVVFASGLLAHLMDRYPVIIYVGAAMLARVGAEMILDDVFVTQLFAPSILQRWCVEGASVLAILVAGRFLTISHREALTPSRPSRALPKRA